MNKSLKEKMSKLFTKDDLMTMMSEFNRRYSVDYMIDPMGRPITDEKLQELYVKINKDSGRQGELFVYHVHEIVVAGMIKKDVPIEFHNFLAVKDLVLSEMGKVFGFKENKISS